MTKDTDYEYRLTASGKTANNCDILASTSANATGRFSLAPEAPTNLSFTEDNVNQQIHLQWNNPAGNNEDGFTIRRTQYDGSNEQTWTVPAGTTSWTDNNGLVQCETYTYQVGATNNCEANPVYSGGNGLDNGEVNVTLSQNMDDIIASVEGSKAYFSDHVQIDWELTGNVTADFYEIYRKETESTHREKIDEVSGVTIYRDYEAQGGILYDYEIVAVATCQTNGVDTKIYSSPVSALGFTLPYGTAAGHVQYEGGNPVQDVSVNFERNNGASTGRSLYFDGSSRAELGNVDLMGDTPWSIEFWAKLMQSGNETRHVINVQTFNSSNQRMMDYKFQVYGWDKSIMLYPNWAWYPNSGPRTNNQWAHYAFTYDPERKELRYWVNGVNTNTRTNVVFNSDDYAYSRISLGHGNNHRHHKYFGYLDELRVWHTVLDSATINQNMNRIIGADQEDLVLYYRMDEGVGNHVYDASKANTTTYNKNDARLYTNMTSMFSEEIPTEDDLGIRGITDENGNYTVDYIPYQGTGEIFTVTPTYSGHAFSPSTKTLYIGDNSPTNNGVDFTDISSFTVSGHVTYDQTTYPVAGAYVMIDGANAIGADNQPVRTDGDGFFSIDVPIGEHYISVYKDGHYFNQGVFPPQDAGAVDPVRYEFTEDITTLEFTDSTYVTVAGRVVGGNVELDKALGFALSQNNVGTAELEFTIQNTAYDLDTETDGVQHTYSVWTDPQTGEYEIQLIPEVWTLSKDIQASGSDDYTILRSELAAVDLTNAGLEVQEDTYTYLNDANQEVTDTYPYHEKLSFMVEVNPVVNVYSQNDLNFPFENTIGETTFSYTVADEEQSLDVALLGLQHPLFKTGATYGAHVYVYQEYSNPDYDADGDGNPDGWVDKVPVQGATITITDNLTFNGPLATSGTTDEAGYFAYSFRAGVPDFSVDNNDPENSYTKTFEVHAQVGSIGYSWLPNGEIFRGHIMGAKPLEGTDFLTAGPDQVDFVLRDPPGSNSYAWVEEGSSFSAAETWEFGYDTDQSFIYDVYKGLLVEAGGGLAGPVVSNETVYKSEYGAEIARSVDNNGTYRRTVTFTERIETSSDPEDVGTMADLYIGKSQNYTMNETLNLVILDKDYCDTYAIPYFDMGGEYVLAQQNSFAIADVADPTYFKYTHRHLVENVIPDLVVQRSRVFNESGKYVSNLPIDHEYYLMPNDHRGFDNIAIFSTEISEGIYETTGPSYTFTQTTPGEIDSVAWFNEQIEAWFNAIQINEAEKAFANTRTNLSIDGSAGAYQSEITEEFSAEYNWNSARSMRLIWNGQFANITNNAGNGVRTTMNLDITGGFGVENEQTRSMSGTKATIIASTLRNPVECLCLTEIILWTTCIVENVLLFNNPSMRVLLLG